MKALYFSSKESSGLTKKFIGFTTETLSKTAPSLFIKISYKVFMNPYSKREYDFQNIEPEEFDIKTRQGNIKLHKIVGGEKHILLTHGWGDTSKSFESLVMHLSNQGYTVWFFDHAGHGKSQTKISNLFAFIDGLESVIAHIEKDNNLYGLISHSMGGVAVLNLKEEFLKTKKVILISAPVMFFEEMYNTFDRIGIAPGVLTQMLEHVSEIYGKSWKTLKPMDQKYKLHEQILVIHDKKDKQCKFENMEKLIENSPVNFKPTEGLGHRRILKDQDVLNSVATFLKF